MIQPTEKIQSAASKRNFQVRFWRLDRGRQQRYPEDQGVFCNVSSAALSGENCGGGIGRARHRREHGRKHRGGRAPPTTPPIVSPRACADSGRSESSRFSSSSQAIMPLCLSALFWCWWARWSRTPVARDRLRAAQELDRKPGRRHRFRLRIQIPHEVESWCCSSVPTRSIRRTISWPETGPRSQQPCGHVRRRGLRRRERLPRVLFERFDKVFGSGVWAKTLIVLLTAGWLGLGHYSVQGLARAEQATIVGLVFGTIFAVTGRIWDADVCARRVRPDRARDDLLESRIRSRSPRLQIRGAVTSVCAR